MNRTYRTVWSSARNAYVVTSEKAKSRGKPSSTRSLLASAIALALTAMAAPNAMALTSCPNTGGSTITIAVGPAETGCILAAGDSLTVASGATISDTAATPVSAMAGAASLDNAGNITFNYTPAPVSTSATTGWGGFWSPAVQGAFTTITNSGTIQGATYLSSGSQGILLTGTSGTLTNSGTISAGKTAIAIGPSSSSSSSSSGAPIPAGTLTSLTNSGTISSTNGTAIVVNNGSNLSNFNNQAGGIVSGSGGGFAATKVAMDTFVNQGTISATSTKSLRPVQILVVLWVCRSQELGLRYLPAELG